MGNMIVSSNQIKARFYNLVIDGEIVEEMLTPRMANILRNEYRAEGMTVDKVEVWTVLNSGDVIDDQSLTFEPNDFPLPIKPANRKFLTPAATDAKIARDREAMRLRNSRKMSQKNRASGGVRYTSVGREKNSTLHSLYVENLRKNGFRVFNRLNEQVWIGFQKEISEKIFNYIKMGGKKSDLDIKFLGK